MMFWPNVPVFRLHLAKHRKCKDLKAIILHVARVVTQGLAHQVSATTSMLHLCYHYRTVY